LPHDGGRAVLASPLLPWSAMPRFDDPRQLHVATHHRKPALRGGARRRPCRIGAPHERSRLRLVYSRPAPSLPFGIHPALPSTLAFAAVSMTALAYAALVDVANGVGAVATRLRASLG
jgi:hypothetical protein